MTQVRQVVPSPRRWLGISDETWRSRRYNDGMITLSVEEMGRDLTGYLARVQAGETLLVLQADRPLAEVKPAGELASGEGKQFRPFGLCAGEFSVPADFDDPLPEDTLNAFESK